MSEKYVKVNLRDHGFFTAGRTGGDPSALKAELNSVLQGKIIDSTIDAIMTEEEKSKKQNEINLLKNDITGFIEQIEQSKAEIQNKLVEKDKIQEEIDAIRMGNEVNDRPVDTFSWMKLGINLFFLVPLSFFLFLFYVATIYKAFYLKAEDIAEYSDGMISVFPSPEEVSVALTNNALLLFAPFIFFGFGYAVHVLLELKTKLKYIYIFLLLLVTFILDFLLAFKIHDMNAEARSFTQDEEPISLLQDTDFYLIIFMGFVVYIIWSVLLNASLSEWKKRNIIGRRVEKIENIKEDITSKQQNIGRLQQEIKMKELLIDNINDELKGVKIPIDKLKFCLSELYAGWLLFITGTSALSELRTICDETYDNFLTENNFNN